MKRSAQDLVDRNPYQPWAIEAGFSNIFEAENAGCFENKAHEFRNGKRLQKSELLVTQARAKLDAMVQGEPERPTPPPFVRVSIADLASVEPPGPAYWWPPYLPAGVVTLLGAHGGIGKSMFGLMLLACIGSGEPLFGIPTQRGRVAFFSGEDGAALVRHRLHRVCRRMQIDPAELDGWVHILDATEGEPALFHEVSIGGRRCGVTTPTYAALRAFLDAHDIGVLIVDNASDTFDASEIDRARVRGFMRALANIAQEKGRAVLLLAHVDKSTSRGDRAGTEGYSGSTAWHNSARSRLYLSKDKDGTLMLEHQKHNLGKMAEPLALQWPEGGIPEVAHVPNGFVQHIADGTDQKALLKLLHTFYRRGEYVATDSRSRYHAVKVLGDEATYPKRRKPAEVFGMLRDAEGRGWIAREAYQDRNRKKHERWALTPAGCDHIGAAAPSAPCAPSTEIQELSHTAQQGAPSAPCAHRGVRGDRARAEPGAEGVAG